MLYHGVNLKDISFKDALFVSVASVTTTGSSTMPIVEQFNFWGQFIIAALMELGAMGFIIFVSFFWTIKNRKMKISDMLVINTSISGDNYNSIKEYSLFIVKIMAQVQLIGIILLSIKFIPIMGVGKGIWFSIFHTISAFSNTGFDLFGKNSLRIFANDNYVQLIISALMILGSFGILALLDLKNNKFRKFKKLKLQTKIILIYSLVLIVVPTILLKIMEPQLSLMNSLFMSSTTRSTGFSVVDVASLKIESKILLMILMFIGGSPTSTSGGVKLVAIAVIVSTMISTIKGENETIMFWKKIPNSVIKKSFTLFMSFLLVLSLTNIVFIHYNNIGVFNIWFESISVMSNTGLLLADYSQLNVVGEFILMFLMYIGKVGPMSMILLFIFGDKKDDCITYPEENLMI